MSGAQGLRESPDRQSLEEIVRHAEIKRQHKKTWLEVWDKGKIIRKRKPWLKDWGKKEKEI